MNVGFCSDLHLGHQMAAELRGFSSVAEHDYIMLEILRTQVNKRTVLWVLGDASMTEEGLRQLETVNCRKKLVRGNHDTFSMLSYGHVFEEILGMVSYKDMWLTHCPIHPQELYRKECNVHGHIHYTAKNKQPRYPYINVNWDFWKRAVSLDELVAIRKVRGVTYPFHNDKVVAE